MERFTCTCEWTWIIGKRKVFGPIWADELYTIHALGCARVMDRAEFNNAYGDCWNAYKEMKSKENHSAFSACPNCGLSGSLPCGCTEE